MSGDCGCQERREKMQDLAGSFADWVRRPYAEDMSAFRWFLFIGLLILILVLWRTVIDKIS